MEPSKAESSLVDVDSSPTSITALGDEHLPPISALPPQVAQAERVYQAAQAQRKHAPIGLFALRDALSQKKITDGGASSCMSWLAPMLLTCPVGALVSCRIVADIAGFLLVVSSYLTLGILLIAFMLLTLPAGMFSGDTIEAEMPPADAQRRYECMMALERARYSRRSSKCSDHIRNIDFPPYPTDAGGAPIHNLDAWGDF